MDFLPEHIAAMQRICREQFDREVSEAEAQVMLERIVTIYRILRSSLQRGFEHHPNCPRHGKPVE